MAEPVRVYWQPGCTSCLRVKEFLGANGIDFVSVNVAADEAGWDELAQLGVRSVPVVAQGERFVFAQVLGAVSDFLGLDEAAGPKLAPAVLVSRLALILETAGRLTAQVPEDRRSYSLPGRERSLHGLAYHIFQIPEVFLACQAGAELTYEALDEPAPEGLATMADIAAYGADVAARIAAWWEGEPDRDGARALATYFGAHSLHVVLERTTWHSAQHTRQLAMMLETLAIAPDRPLDAAALADLPLPEKVWEAP
jgi:glutaredoxin